MEGWRGGDCGLLWDESTQWPATTGRCGRTLQVWPHTAGVTAHCRCARRVPWLAVAQRVTREGEMTVLQRVGPCVRSCVAHGRVGGCWCPSSVNTAPEHCCSIRCQLL